MAGVSKREWDEVYRKDFVTVPSGYMVLGFQRCDAPNTYYLISTSGEKVFNTNNLGQERAATEKRVVLIPSPHRKTFKYYWDGRQVPNTSNHTTRQPKNWFDAIPENPSKLVIKKPRKKRVAKSCTKSGQGNVNTAESGIS